MVTLTTAENALKTVYLGVVANQLNINANPLLGKIKQSSTDVWGKEIRKLAPYGINGGIGAGTEDGKLPTAAGNSYVQFVSDLKNLYGTIEISDKAIRASQNNAGAFVNLLNAEMEGLIKASAFNFSRMLYGNGSGILCGIDDANPETHEVYVDSVKNLMEGMVVQIFNGETLANEETARIVYIDRANKIIKFDHDFYMSLRPSLDKIVLQNSLNNEITGLGKIFDTTSTTLYGVDKTVHNWLNPYVKTSVGSISDSVMQEAIDTLDEVTGSTVDFITCSSKVKRFYQEYLASFRRNIDVMELAGGYKAMSYNGIPVVSDRFIEDDTMYLLNTKDFTLHQLCDWQWLEGEDGRVIRQTTGYPVYTATLVKYADLICDRPAGQAKLSGITQSV